MAGADPARSAIASWAPGQRLLGIQHRFGPGGGILTADTITVEWVTDSGDTTSI
jgi:hypothetical protein